MVRSHATEMNEKESPTPEVSPDIKFEAALAEIERIVQNMESGELPLEESILAYRRGSELLRHCQKQLSEAERKIRIFENGELHDANLDASGKEGGR